MERGGRGWLREITGQKKPVFGVSSGEDAWSGARLSGSASRRFAAAAHCPERNRLRAFFVYRKQLGSSRRNEHPGPEPPLCARRVRVFGLVSPPLRRLPAELTRTFTHNLFRVFQRENGHEENTKTNEPRVPVKKERRRRLGTRLERYRGLDAAGVRSCSV